MAIKGTEKFMGGFSSLRYFYYSWVISFFQTKKYFDKITFYTDTNGYKLLKPLGLPFDDIITDFDYLPYDTKFWAMGKVNVFSRQTKPFLHIDYDAFIWEDVNKLMSAPVIFQMREKDESHYRANINTFNSKTKIRIPEIEYFRTHKGLSPYNMGFYGGSDTKNIRKCAENILEIIEKKSLNKVWDHLILHDNDTYLNCFVEQLYTSSYMMMNKIKPTIMMDTGFKFTHIWGSTKKHDMVMKKLKARMVTQYPAYKELIDSITN